MVRLHIKSEQNGYKKSHVCKAKLHNPSCGCFYLPIKHMFSHEGHANKHHNECSLLFSCPLVTKTSVHFSSFHGGHRTVTFINSANLRLNSTRLYYLGKMFKFKKKYTSIHCIRIFVYFLKLHI